MVLNHAFNEIKKSMNPKKIGCIRIFAVPKDKMEIRYEISYNIGGYYFHYNYRVQIPSYNDGSLSYNDDSSLFNGNNDILQIIKTKYNK